MVLFMLSDKENDFCIANQWSKSVFYLSCFFWIINTITDDNNSRVSYAFHSLPSSLSTKNVHKFFTFWLPSKSSHMPSCLAFFIMVLTCYNPCSYPMTSFLISCAIEECIRNFPFFLFFLCLLNASWLLSCHACTHLMLFLSLLALFFFVYSNLRAF